MMKIEVLRAENRAQSSTIAALLYQFLMRKVSFTMNSARSCVVEVESWEAFLRILWAAYAQMSRTSAGSMMSTPIRVVLADYAAYTDVSASSEGIRYTALSRL